VGSCTQHTAHTSFVVCCVRGDSISWGCVPRPCLSAFLGKNKLYCLKVCRIVTKFLCKWSKQGRAEREPGSWKGSHTAHILVCVILSRPCKELCLQLILPVFIVGTVEQFLLIVLPSKNMVGIVVPAHTDCTYGTHILQWLCGVVIVTVWEYESNCYNSRVCFGHQKNWNFQQSG